jgi:hypothetical protein
MLCALPAVCFRYKELPAVPEQYLCVRRKHPVRDVFAVFAKDTEKGVA